MDSNGDATRLFRHYNSNAVALVSDAQGSTMAKTEFLGNVQIVGNGQDTASSLDAIAGNNHSAIVQGRILEEEVFYQSLIDAGVEALTCGHNIVERCCALDDNQCSDLLFAHAHTGHHNRHDDLFQFLGILFFLVYREETS